MKLATRLTASLAAAVLLASAPVYAQATTPAAPQHGPTFESQRKQADELYTANKPLEALPLYEDLSRQDPTVAVFAERMGAGLLAKEPTLADANARLQTHLRAINELKRAQKLGDNSEYVRVTLLADSKTFVGAVQSGVPLTVGYTYHGKPEAQAAFHDAESAFGRADYSTASVLYMKAAEIDPAWYDCALYAGDSFFRLKDGANAGTWFAKAIAIDPDRETAYRYWADALYAVGNRDAAREKIVNAVVAEPYAPTTFAKLQQWVKVTGHMLVKPAITRPEFITPNGELKIDPALTASTKDGRASWIVYQQYRVAHGARVLNQVIVAGSINTNAVVTTKDYRHTIAEEHAALRAMLADVDANIKTGVLAEADLDPGIRNIRSLEQNNYLGAWIAINAADAGIRSDYPAYRSHHRKHLFDYVNDVLIRNAAPAAPAAAAN